MSAHPPRSPGRDPYAIRFLAELLVAASHTPRDGDNPHLELHFDLRALIGELSDRIEQLAELSESLLRYVEHIREDTLPRLAGDDDLDGAGVAS